MATRTAKQHVSHVLHHHMKASTVSMTQERRCTYERDMKAKGTHPHQVQLTIWTGIWSFEASGYRLGDIWTVYKMESIQKVHKVPATQVQPTQTVPGGSWFKRIPDVPFILKINDDEDRFNEELTIYKRLEKLQGSVVPYLYGTATCVQNDDGNHIKQVLLLEYIEGYQLSAIPPEDKSLVINLLYPTYEEISRLDVIHGDPSLNNAIYVPGCSKATVLPRRRSWVRILEFLRLSSKKVALTAYQDFESHDEHVADEDNAIQSQPPPRVILIDFEMATVDKEASIINKNDAGSIVYWFSLFKDPEPKIRWINMPPPAPDSR
ncbi:MAG: hypothetical protein M1823_004098 [Watsoniomyces obsoletus]|nr:MAG: hypothetical protein M1823_004098 [Watsoniomyces obsoletus]